MAEPTIICPKCKNEIKLNESLAAPLIEATRQEYEKRLSQKDLDIASREKSVRDGEAALSKAKEDLENQVEERLKGERAKISADEARKAKVALGADLTQKTTEIAELQEVLKQRDEKLAQAQKAQGDLIRKQRELDDAKREMELTIEKRIQESVAAARDGARKEAEERLSIQVSEKDRAIAKMEEQIGDINKRERDFKDREASLLKEQSALEQRVTEKLNQERETIAANESKKARIALAADINQKAKEVADLQEILKQRDEKLAQAQNAQAELLKKQRELDDAKRELELTVQTRVQEALEETRGKARKEAEGELNLKIAEREQTIASMQQKIEELKRKAEQGSQQLQGEVLELQLESLLAAKFPHDRIEPVPKGEHGGDILQRVVLPTGTVCGTIIWETKRTKNWSDGWLSKLREDQRAAKAEVSVLVSAVLPKGVDTFDQIDDVCVAHPRAVLPVALFLRQRLIEVNSARLASEGQQTKMELVYQYLTGPKFRLRVQAIVETFSSMQESLHKEKKVIMAQWEKRQEQIELVMQSTVGMYGDLQGIAGQTIQEIEGLELKALEAPKTPEEAP